MAGGGPYGGVEAVLPTVSSGVQAEKLGRGLRWAGDSEATGSCCLEGIEVRELHTGAEGSSPPLPDVR